MLFPVSDDVPDLDSGPVLVAAWAAELTRTAAIPPALSAVELERLLTGVVTTLSLAGAAVPLDVERARGAGASLAYAGLVVPDVLPVTIAAPTWNSLPHAARGENSRYGDPSSSSSSMRSRAVSFPAA